MLLSMLFPKTRQRLEHHLMRAIPQQLELKSHKAQKGQEASDAFSSIDPFLIALEEVAVSDDSRPELAMLAEDGDAKMQMDVDLQPFNRRPPASTAPKFAGPRFHPSMVPFSVLDTSPLQLEMHVALTMLHHL